MIPMDWLFGLAGGLMIGTAAAIFLLMNGRIMGASGILGSFVDGLGRTAEREVFIAGLFAVPGLVALITAPANNATASLPLLILGGLAVGYGTRLGNGCTSGHGVCGISRFSLRGIVATCTFLAAGAVTMAIGRHVLGVI